MRRHGGKTKTITFSNLQRGVGWFSSIVALAILLTACGGKGEGNQPPITSAASLKGVITFTNQVPLAPPPADAFDGPVPGDARFGARVVDPGDDIGSVPLPKPSTLSSTGSYEFEELDQDPMAYLNLRFTVDAGLEKDGSLRTPVGFNIPIALADGIGSLLSGTIDRPSDTVLQAAYTYRGPDGSREIRFKIDFVSDLITFDFDSDGLYDDLIAVDYNHDAIPDEQAPVIESVDYTKATEVIGVISGAGSNSVSVGGMTYQVWGSTNAMNSATGAPISLSEVSIGSNATIRYAPFAGGNLAVSVAVVPSPTDPQGALQIRRDGVIEEITDTTIYVGGILFQDYPNAEIEDVLGTKVQPDALLAGEFVTVFGVRDGGTVDAVKIITKEVAPPPAYVERQGTIQALMPPTAPTKMTVGDITFDLTSQTVIKDLSGRVVGTGYLVVGNPVWVFGHVSGEAIIADLVELQYTIDQNPPEPEVIVLVDDTSALADVETAIGALGPTVPVTTVVVASYPPAPTDPDCIESAFNALYTWALYKIKDLDGFMGAFPRSEDDQCTVLVIIRAGSEGTIPWVDYLTGGDIGGAPVEYDIAAQPPFYGSGPQLTYAQGIADGLTEALGSNEHFLCAYASPDVGFSGD